MAITLVNADSSPPPPLKLSRHSPLSNRHHRKSPHPLPHVLPQHLPKSLQLFHIRKHSLRHHPILLARRVQQEHAPVLSPRAKHLPPIADIPQCRRLTHPIGGEL